MPKKIYPWEFWSVPKKIAERNDLKPLDKLIVGVLVTRWNGENQEPIKARLDKVADQLGTSLISIKRSFKRLKELKIISSNRRYKKCNKYTLNI